MSVRWTSEANTTWISLAGPRFWLRIANPRFACTEVTVAWRCWHTTKTVPPVPETDWPGGAGGGATVGGVGTGDGESVGVGDGAGVGVGDGVAAALVGVVMVVDATVGRVVDADMPMGAINASTAFSGPLFTLDRNHSTPATASAMAAASGAM